MSPKVSVRFPNFFEGRLSEYPILNEHYTSIQHDLEDDLISACELSQSQAEAVRKCKSTFFAAAMIPFASEKTLRLGCDWLGWVFIFDDCLDNGEIRNDPNRAKNFTESLLSILDDEGSEERRMYCGIDATNPIVRFHDGLWHFIRTNSSQGIARRYAAAMKQYCHGALAQVQQTALSETPEIEEVLSRRRQSVCVLSLFALVELAHGIDLPDEFHDNPTIQEIQAHAVDVTLLHNDLLSYHKEELEGVPHNILAAFILSGMAAQEAVDIIGAAIDQSLLRLEQAIEEVSDWKAPWWEDSMQYIQGIMDVIKANLYWSFYSDRFFSQDQKTRLMTTRMLDIPITSTGVHSGDFVFKK